jgi:hypothetical protein
MLYSIHIFCYHGVVDDPEFAEPSTARPITELLAIRKSQNGMHMRTGAVHLPSEGMLTNRGRKAQPVEQLDMETGEVVHRYASATEAAILIKGSQGIISEICRGKGKTAYNFGWRLYDGPLTTSHPDFFKPPGFKPLDQLLEIKRIPSGTPKAVEQINLATGMVLAIHCSGSEAAKNLGSMSKAGSISNACNGKIKSVCGFGWRFQQPASAPGNTSPLYSYKQTLFTRVLTLRFDRGSYG